MRYSNYSGKQSSRRLYVSGWMPGPRRIEVARERGLLLQLDAEASNRCNLRCVYCFRREAVPTGTSPSCHLDLRARQQLIDEAVELGCESVKIVGAGEPFLDPDFPAQVEHMLSRRVKVIIFTNGITLADSIPSFVMDANVSVILKYDARGETQDRLAQCEGYSKVRDAALRALIRYGLNRGVPSRLGVDVVITTLNISEILDIVRMCREENLFPLIKPFLPKGAAKEVPQLRPVVEVLRKLSEDVRSLDEIAYGLRYEARLPYLGGAECRQLSYAIYVDIAGNTYACPGSEELLGNVRESSLSEIWTRPTALRWRHKAYSGCPFRSQYGWI